MISKYSNLNDNSKWSLIFIFYTFCGFFLAVWALSLSRIRLYAPSLRSPTDSKTTSHKV